MIDENLTKAQISRLWDNSPEIQAEVKSKAAFYRLVPLMEDVYQIGRYKKPYLIELVPDGEMHVCAGVKGEAYNYD